MARGAKALSARAFEAAANEEDALILDVRDKTAFNKGFIPNSIFIGIDGSFASWVGALITDLEQPILLVTPKGREKETITRLTRVGYDNTIGYLEGGFEAWKNHGEVDTIETIDVATFEKNYNKEINVLDVRKPGEWTAEHIDTAQHFALDYINKQMTEVNHDKMYYMHCRSGYRSTVAASILKSRGFNNIVNIQGLFTDIATSSIPTGDFVCPSTLK